MTEYWNNSYNNSYSNVRVLIININICGIPPTPQLYSLEISISLGFRSNAFYKSIEIISY